MTYVEQVIVTFRIVKPYLMDLVVRPPVRSHFTYHTAVCYGVYTCTGKFPRGSAYHSKCCRKYVSLPT